MHWRRISEPILKDLTKKMVMCAGPRQCGKTTLSKGLFDKEIASYYNWDLEKHQRQIRSQELNPDSKLWIFDELHKYKNWRNWLKGIYDEFHDRHSIFVTGSARLDYYSRGGDSLQGRYFFHRLHPFTFSEIEKTKLPERLSDIAYMGLAAKSNQTAVLQSLFKLGGFPEPFLSGSEKESSRWRGNYGRLLVREEIRELESFQNFDKIELLFERLIYTVGSVLSVNSLREDLNAGFVTVEKWIKALERTYGVFRLSPFGPPRIKAVKKESKLYFWDWSRVNDPAARFENLVAVHLLRLVHWFEDVEGQKMELRYFKNVVGHEVDFIVLKDSKPWLAVEVKLDDRPLSSGLKYFLERISVPYAFQVSLQGQKDYELPKINGCHVRILTGARFLMNLV